VFLSEKRNIQSLGAGYTCPDCFGMTPMRILCFDPNMQTGLTANDQSYIASVTKGRRGTRFLACLSSITGLGRAALLLVILCALCVLPTIKALGASRAHSLPELTSSRRLGHEPRTSSCSVLSPVSAKGPASAPVSVVEFADFECPFCGKVAPVVRELIQAYPDEIRFVFKHDPLSSHPHSRQAHEAALAAGAQGKFWEMHDLLFANQARLTHEDLLRYAQQLGLNLAIFRRALDDRSCQSLVELDSAEANGLGINSTPTFFINGQKFVGAQSLEVLQGAVNQALHPAPAAATSQRPFPTLGTARDVLIGHAPVRGAKQASVTIVEFTDFQCPFCANAVPTIKHLMEQYPDQVKWVFKNFPLDIHQDSVLAHHAALAAGAQGKFWEMHDRIFGNQRAIRRDDLIQSARDLGLDMTQFISDLDSGRFTPVVEADKNQGSLLGVSGTPTFFIDGKPLVGAPPLDQFKAIIETDLKSPPGPGRASEDFAVASKIPANTAHEPAPSTPGQMPTAAEKVNEKQAKIESPTKGPSAAPISIVWYSDFQSPLSPRAYELVRQVMSDYPGQVSLVFKNSPLDFHAEAMLAHEAAMAAAAQGKFWEMHDLVLAHSNAINKDDLLAYGKQLGLDLVKLAKALDEHIYRPKIEEDLADARTQGVFGVPAFLLNGKRLDGVQPISVVQQLIDSELKTQHEAMIGH
jgi:protein-disulfide isomerase